jgi:hypothetical protein
MTARGAAQEAQLTVCAAAPEVLVLRRDLGQDALRLGVGHRAASLGYFAPPRKSLNP